MVVAAGTARQPLSPLWASPFVVEEHQLAQLLAVALDLAPRRCVRKDREVVWVSVDAAPIRDESGRVGDMVVAIRDVMEHKQVEEELIRLASFPELNPTLIVEASTSGEPTFLNLAARERFPDLFALGPRHPILADLASMERSLAEIECRRDLTPKVSSRRHDFKMLLEGAKAG